MTFTLEHNLRNPTALSNANTPKGHLTSDLAAPISEVLSRFAFPKICDPVVKTISVDVINEERKAPVIMKPDHAMNLKQAVIDGDLKIIAAICSNAHSRQRSARYGNTSRQDSGQRIVVKQIPNQFQGQIFGLIFSKLSHPSKPYEEQNEDGSGNPDASKTDEQRAEDERRYVEHRLKTIAAWERKIRNGKM